MSEGGVSEAIEAALGEGETLEYKAETPERTIVATDRRLLSEDDFGVNAIDYTRIETVGSGSHRTVTNWSFLAVGAVISVVGVLATVSEPAVGVFVLFIGAYIVYTQYKAGKVVEIRVRGRDDPIRIQFGRSKKEAKRLERLVEASRGPEAETGTETDRDGEPDERAG